MPPRLPLVAAAAGLLAAGLLILADRSTAPETAIAAGPARPVPAVQAGREHDADRLLVWHAETADGGNPQSRRPDAPLNPASVVKVATTLWALERLGPEHRFETGFGVRGTLHASSGFLHGDLVVVGSGDPDFHVENAFLVGRTLNRLGVRRVGGSLLVDRSFWLGWEGGAEGRERDPVLRARAMAERLREALDPALWSVATRRSMDEFMARRGLSGTPPRVVIEGAAGLDAGAGPDRVLLTHRSNPLALTLRRFNAYSNNDIERLGASLGTAEELSDLMARRWSAPRSEVRFETLSGLGSNRLSPRRVVRLLGDLRRACERLGLEVSDVLPMAGCDPGTLKHFPRLQQPEIARSLVAKTGTLTSTDGGVAVLAGFVSTAQGERVFCVAAPRAGDRLVAARSAQERWVLDLLAGAGGASPRSCGPTLPYSDQTAEVLAATPTSGG